MFFAPSFNIKGVFFDYFGILYLPDDLMTCYDGFHAQKRFIAFG